ncbi:MAG: thiamine phosphate synthase [Planctomycetota bacterium]|nr:thiamine phosphate synthase [Planctomycetota bacterium]
MYARDVDGDVGADEEQRGGGVEKIGLKDVALAGMKRAQEAARVLEEVLRAAGRDSEAVEVAKARYELYILERDLTLRASPSKRLSGVRLYVLVTPELCRRGLEETVKMVIDGGAEMIQFRQKTWEDGRYLEEARKVQDICRERGVIFIINDRVDVAAAISADGVHLGRKDMPVGLARRILGPSAIIGSSTRGGEEAREASEAGSDYIAVGPVFETPTAAGKTPVGLETLRRTLAMNLPAPVFPIGGITAENARKVIEAGGDRLAVCSAIIGKEDAREETAAMRGLLSR